MDRGGFQGGFQRQVRAAGTQMVDGHVLRDGEQPCRKTSQVALIQLPATTGLFEVRDVNSSASASLPMRKRR
jgi:hypothetical protein